MTTPTTKTCPMCGKEFPYRSNKRFCSEKCRKRSAQKKSRSANPVNAASSPGQRRQQAEDYDLMKRLGERLYTLPPGRRLGFVEEVIQAARRPHGGALRRVLTNPKFIWPDKTILGLFHRKAPAAYMTFPQAAEKYCQMSPWQSGLQAVVRGEAPEPPTGECPEDQEGTAEPSTMAA
ncbi:hypothetical protein [Antarctobacter jejuensis]|uniref:hypothetical protein n=1 Tax=Antarctobacter jejuensis TaxID=1439938 RepID=UPI003FCFEA02